MENQKSVTDLIEEVRAEICDKYCKYRDRELGDNEIEKLCENCPLNKL